MLSNVGTYARGRKVRPVLLHELPSRSARKYGFKSRPKFIVKIQRNTEIAFGMDGLYFIPNRKWFLNSSVFWTTC
jgi:hypothetical protein